MSTSEVEIEKAVVVIEFGKPEVYNKKRKTRLIEGNGKTSILIYK